MCTGCKRFAEIWSNKRKLALGVNVSRASLEKKREQRQCVPAGHSTGGRMSQWSVTKLQEASQGLSKLETLKTFLGLSSCLRWLSCESARNQCPGRKERCGAERWWLTLVHASLLCQMVAGLRRGIQGKPCVRGLPRPDGWRAEETERVAHGWLGRHCSSWHGAGMDGWKVCGTQSPTHMWVAHCHPDRPPASWALKICTQFSKNCDLGSGGFSEL